MSTSNSISEGPNFTRLYYAVYTYFLVRLEDVASEGVIRHFSSDVAEDLQVLRVMGHIEDPARKKDHFMALESHSESCSQPSKIPVLA